MKMILCVPVLLFVWLCGCALLPGKDPVKDFIPGVYVRHYTDEYTDSYDTIRIEPMTSGGSEGFSITKRSRFQKISNEGKFQPGYTIRRSAADYDPVTQTLRLRESGKELFFDPLENELLMGGQAYKKLN